MEPTMTNPQLAATRGSRGRGGHAGTLRDEIKQLLLDLKLRPGDAIPSETALIEMLGVSRGSLREALKSLQALGILESHHGSGTFVSSLSFETLADGMIFHTKLGGADDLTTVAELADIREILETSLIRRVATTIKPDHLDRLDGFIAGMQEAGNHTEFDVVDRQFHSALYSELDRRLVNQLLEAFWRALSAARTHLPQAFMSTEEAVAKHRAIVDALRAGDPDAAGHAMQDHFASTRDWVGLTID